jgi:glutathione S-transferase
MILVHYLRVGRPLYTVWLLEELGLDYELEVYLRDPETMRAPPELKQAHPLGKSPVIVDGDLTIAESGAIAAYLIDTYDTAGALAPPRDDTRAWTTYNQWLHYPEGSAFASLLMKLLLSREAEPLPPLVSGFATGEVALQLGYIQDSLGDKPFILGDTLQTPDIGVTYIVALADRLGELGPYPALVSYLERNTARPAYMRAKQRGGET